MPCIKEIKAREIIDSRGEPTVECDVILDNNSFGRASVPCGKSKGKHEAVEIRDNDNKRFFGKGVSESVKKINDLISKSLIGVEIIEQKEIDRMLIDLDGTNNKSNLGSNTILSVSLACAKAGANSMDNYLYEYLGRKNDPYILPVPLINIINGGSHADNNIDIQEFMIAPTNVTSFKEAIQISCEVFFTLKSILKKRGLSSNVGDEGGFAPSIKSSNEAIELILESITKSNFIAGKDFFLALDVASTEFFSDGLYNLNGENKKLNNDQMCNYLSDLCRQYPIFSIEDGMSEDDWEGWKIITDSLGSKIQLVGDDLFVTNMERLKKGIKQKISNSILIKVNQIGTLTETMEVIEYSQKNNYSNIISHRSGETEDTTIADLAVATNSGQIKTGSLSRSERLSKYNQLLRIEENLGIKAKYAGKDILKFKI